MKEKKVSKSVIFLRTATPTDVNICVCVHRRTLRRESQTRTRSNNNPDRVPIKNILKTLESGESRGRYQAWRDYAAPKRRATKLRHYRRRQLLLSRRSRLAQISERDSAELDDAGRSVYSARSLELASDQSVTLLDNSIAIHQSIFARECERMADDDPLEMIDL